MRNRLIRCTIIGSLAFSLLLTAAVLRSPAAEQENGEVAESNQQTGRNLVENGTFENGLKGWTTVQGDVRKIDVVHEAQHNCVRLSSTSGDASTYVIQTLDPQLLRSHRVCFEVKMKAEAVVPGKFPYSHAKIILLENDGTKDISHEMDFDGTFDWKVVHTSWQISANCQKATLYLGLHTTTGTVWYDNVQVVVPKLLSERTLESGVQERIYQTGKAIYIEGHEFAELKPNKTQSDFLPTEAEKARGFTLYRTEEPSDMVPDRFPAREEVLDGETPLKMVAAADQYEPLAFAVWAFQPLERVCVKATELVGPKDNRIPATEFEIRLGRQVIQRVGYDASEYHVAPKLLERYREINITPAMPHLYWLTLHVPAAAVAGEYTGKILVEVGNQTAVLPVQLQVLPFQLATNKPWRLFYYNSDPANAELYFRDMRDHGMTSVILAQVNASLHRDGERAVVDFVTSDAFVAAYRKAGFEGPLVYNPFHDRLATRLLELFGLADKFPKVVNYGESICVFQENEYPAQLQESCREVVRSIVAHAQQANWPPLLFYAVDEPNDPNDWRTTAARLEYRLTKEAVPSLPTFCTAYTLDAMKNVEPWLDVRTVPIHNLLNSAESLRSFHEHMQQAGGEMWGIEWPAMWDDFWRSRQLGGFQPAKAGVSAMTAWAYYTPLPWTDEYNDLRGQYKGCYLVYRNADGELIPTLTWEGIRAGVTDWRYIATLEEAIAKATGEKRLRGEKTLQAILDSIPLDSESSTEWHNSRANELRSRIAAAICDLQQ
jgi:hypothetical protein